MAHASPARAVARILERRHVTRSGMARISVLVALGAAVWFTQEGDEGPLVGSAFLALVLCCDAVGAAMSANRRDSLTLWLVTMLGQLREYIVYTGLALGAVAAGIAGAWAWAAGALIALALRNSLLVARKAPAALAQGRSAVRGSVPAQRSPGGLLGGLGVPAPRRSGNGDPELTGRLLGADGARDGRVSAAPRVRQEEATGHGPVAAVVSLPDLACRWLSFTQPVRFLVIGVTTLVWDPRVAFVTLVIGCAIAVTSELVGAGEQVEQR
ncbi:hypothetical protein [Nocardiopsis xinjiangensis]|uniref:hypothetical protein n=1 Tax=Nocardiopsis xinjiangensis TaxID=124285 RepID=UPI000346335D|nr:hypothetical protein [Nocardiopsis xinjiangensis]